MPLKAGSLLIFDRALAAFAMSLATPEDSLLTSSGQYRGPVRVRQLHDLLAFKTEVRGTPTQNDSNQRSCRDWVMKALELLESEAVLDEEEYVLARRSLVC